MSLTPEMREFMQSLINRTTTGKMKWTRDSPGNYEYRAKDGNRVSVNGARMQIRNRQGDFIDEVRIPGVHSGEANEYLRELMGTITDREGTLRSLSDEPRPRPVREPRPHPLGVPWYMTPRAQTGLIWRVLRWLLGR